MLRFHSIFTNCSLKSMWMIQWTKKNEFCWCYISSRWMFYLALILFCELSMKTLTSVEPWDIRTLKSISRNAISILCGYLLLHIDEYPNTLTFFFVFLFFYFAKHDSWCSDFLICCIVCILFKFVVEAKNKNP